MHIDIFTYIHICTCIYIYIYMHISCTYTHIYIHTYIHINIYTYIQYIHIHTYIYTYIHTYIYTNIHIYIYASLMHNWIIYTWYHMMADWCSGWWTWWTGMGRTWRRHPSWTRSLPTPDSCCYIWSIFHLVNLWAAYCTA